MLQKQQISQIINKFKTSDLDTGSSEVQVALLTERIRELTEHFKIHKKDVHGRRGLLHLVNRRVKLLKYLKRTDEPKYFDLIAHLKLRK